VKFFLVWMMKVGDIVRLKRKYVFAARYHSNIGMITALLGWTKRRTGIARVREGECASVLMGGKVLTLFTEVLEVVNESR